MKKNDKKANSVPELTLDDAHLVHVRVVKAVQKRFFFTHKLFQRPTLSNHMTPVSLVNAIKNNALERAILYKNCENWLRAGLYAVADDEQNQDLKMKLLLRPHVII